MVLFLQMRDGVRGPLSSRQFCLFVFAGGGAVCVEFMYQVIRRHQNESELEGYFKEHKSKDMKLKRD